MPLTAMNSASMCPNPFAESTLIQYYLSVNADKALIRVSTLEGRPVQDLALPHERGRTQVEFHTQGLANGTYLYSLFVNGALVGSKKMVVAR